MANLKKEEALEVKHVYCLSAEEYTADYADGCNDDGVNPYKGKCVMGIYKEDFEALKEAGFPCKEFTQVVLASSEYDDMKDSSKYDDMKDSSKHTVRQAMFKHIVYVDEVSHTNF